jgi:hypothetical protein
LVPANGGAGQFPPAPDKRTATGSRRVSARVHQRGLELSHDHLRQGRHSGAGKRSLFGTPRGHIARTVRRVRGGRRPPVGEREAAGQAERCDGARPAVGSLSYLQFVLDGEDAGNPVRLEPRGVLVTRVVHDAG